MRYDTIKFIDKSLNIHGYKYDYSLVEYINSYTKVKIICKEHGIFEQSPSKHLCHQGCIKCFHLSETSNSINFIEKSISIHGDRYDYSLVEYVNSYTKVKIICKEHGVFEQQPSSHLKNQNCPICTNNAQRLTTQLFIEKSNIIHNNKYDYSLVDYKNNINNIMIICPIHGEFEQRPSNHLFGSGCKKCQIENIKNDTYIEKCKLKFNNKYDYSLVEYKNNRTKVKIKCSEHGIFEQTLKDHLKSNGCPFCSGKKMNTELFIKKSEIKHNYFFDYSLSEYNVAFEKLKILCPKHGLFEQTASMHLFGAGCPICKASKGEKEIISFLNEQKINFEHQKKFNDCKHINELVFDFFIPDKNLCIEFNGEQHYKVSEYFGGLESFKITKLSDNIKKVYCKNNNIDFKIITYKDNIKKKLIKILND